MANTTGTITLSTKTLPAPCDSVYLLTEQIVPGDGTITYEASLNGGQTWDTVTPGDLATLNHTGDELSLRVTMSLPEESEDDPPEVFWIVAYAKES